MPAWNDNRSARPSRNGSANRHVSEDDDGTPLLREHVAQLESRLKQLTESYDVADRLIMPWERFMDGDRLLFPSGFPSDRKAGRNWPTITTEQDLRQARAFCRLIGDTNPLVIAFLDHVTNFVVKTGFKWQATLRGQKKATAYGAATDPDIEACQQVLDDFRQLAGWGDEAGFTVGEFDDDDYSPQVNLEHEGWRRAMRDGEFFLRLFRGGSDTNGIPTVRVVEPECVQCPNGDTQGDWSWGILTDPADSRRRKAVYVVGKDGLNEGEAVPAGRVLQLKLNVDGDVKRGMPDFWPLQDEVQNAQKLWQNTLEVNSILAAIAYIRQHAPGVTGTQVNSMLSNRSTDGQNLSRTPYPYATNDRGTNRTELYTRSEAGQVIEISNGMQYQPGPSATGTAGQISAMQSIFRIVGIRWGCPEYFSGDSSNANFASTLVSGGPFEIACVTRQGHYKRFQGELAKRVLILACESGRLRRDQVMKCEIKVTPPAVAIANRAEDTQRRSQLVQGAGLSKTTWLMEEGYDPDQEAANVAEESKREAAQQQPPPGAGGPGAPVPAGPGGGGTPSPLTSGPDAGGGDVDLSTLLGEGRKVSEAFAETDHPRDDSGRFVSAGDMAAAKADPSKADALRARVTDPAQRAKLDDELDGTGDPAGDAEEEAWHDETRGIESVREKEDESAGRRQEKERDRAADQAATRAEKWFGRQESDLEKRHGREYDQLDKAHGREYDRLTAEWDGLGMTGDARAAKESQLTARHESEVSDLLARQSAEMDALHDTAGERQSQVEAEILADLMAALDDRHAAEDAAAADRRQAEDGERAKRMPARLRPRAAVSESRLRLLHEIDPPDGFLPDGTAFYLEDRSGLVKKVITNKLGRKQTIYVRPNTDAAADADKTVQDRVDSQTAVATAVGQLDRLTMSQFHRLDSHIAALSRDEIRGHLKALGEKIGGAKVELATRLLAKVRAEHGKVEPAMQPRPETVVDQNPADVKGNGSSGEPVAGKPDDRPAHEMTADERKAESERIKRDEWSSLSVGSLADGTISPLQLQRMGKAEKERYNAQLIRKMDLQDRLRQLSRTDDDLASGQAKKTLAAADSTALQLHSRIKFLSTMARPGEKTRPKMQKEIDAAITQLQAVQKDHPELVEKYPIDPDAANFTGTAANGVKYVNGVPQKSAADSGKSEVFPLATDDGAGKITGVGPQPAATDSEGPKMDSPATVKRIDITKLPKRTVTVKSTTSMSNTQYHAAGKPTWWVRVHPAEGGSYFADIPEVRGDKALSVEVPIPPGATVHYGVGPQGKYGVRQSTKYKLMPLEAAKKHLADGGELPPEVLAEYPQDKYPELYPIK